MPTGIFSPDGFRITVRYRKGIMQLTTDKMNCKCGHGPRTLEIGEGAVYCGVCQGPITIPEKLNDEIALHAINQQARINELLTEILRLQAEVYRLTNEAKELRHSLDQLDPR